ncbi:MAG TPA: UDP-N-acetylglucosamine--N-acetylmuramyl-(pentapeptide) pyrophosphoryl-undecaprenol N-acetylglucosamine transferase, partial [Chromatiales bacterium]|nr:UDP-N-acetylglucosamine--N-acetylmuramyl-(pentapeptide) pyrophosphoryl-undecaprenol N-acetylglucosamine transferase [Chromatiales bacterium]
MALRVLIMAGGTGGHIFPALAVAECLRGDGAEVRWLGTRHGMEARIVPGAGIPMDVIAIGALRGKGPAGWVLLPLRMGRALLQSLIVIMRYRPLVVLGMGGFVSGPGAVMAWLLRIPLVIHEQNAIAGLTNRVLSRMATRTLMGFPGAIAGRKNLVVTGNPVRGAIAELPPP